mmetsp:Transcript_3713/g.5722  ORF Transcript_3713/g.5722 Transcript_3713/m.5722 type:complete len:207 (-) Transcript_3713:610-1230(-)
MMRSPLGLKATSLVGYRLLSPENTFRGFLNLRMSQILTVWSPPRETSVRLSDPKTRAEVSVWGSCASYTFFLALGPVFPAFRSQIWIDPSFPAAAIMFPLGEKAHAVTGVRLPPDLGLSLVYSFDRLSTLRSQIRIVPSSDEVRISLSAFGFQCPSVRAATCPTVCWRSWIYISPRLLLYSRCPSLSNTLAHRYPVMHRNLPPFRL